MTTPVQPLRVTGYAVLSALGATRTEHLDALAHGKSGLGASPLPLPFDTAVGEVQSELPELPAALAPWSTRLARMSAHLIAELEPELRRARERWRPERIALVIGTSTAGAATTEEAFKGYIQDGSFPSGYDFERQHTFGAVLHVIAELSGARGPAWVISTACSASAKVFATARRLIAAGLADAAIVGGVDTLCRMTLQGFQSLQALDYQPCRPFSAERSGISIGEGGAFALVERSGEARVLIEGVGETSEAYHISAPHPEGRGAKEAMALALAQGGRAPDEIDHVNAHGTGTRHNDSSESNAIEALCGTAVPVVSTKGYTGHTLGAAGAIEFAFSAYAIEEGWIPPSIRADPIDEVVRVNVCRQRLDRNVQRVLSNSFAFGGNNVSLLVGAP